MNAALLNEFHRDPLLQKLCIYSIDPMRARLPEWFREDLDRLSRALASGEIRPRVAQRSFFEEVPEVHRRLEAGGLDDKLVLCPEFSRCLSCEF